MSHRSTVAKWSPAFERGAFREIRHELTSCSNVKASQAEMYNEVIDRLGIHQDILSSARLACAHLIRSGPWRTLTAVVIFAHLAIAVVETDSNAAGVPSPEWMYHIQICFLCVYVLEIVFGTFVYRWRHWLDPGNVIDCGLVAADIVLMTATNARGLSYFRLLRLFRVFRVLRSFVMFREVYLMLQGVVSAARSIMFGSVISFVLITAWSVVAVEVFHPRVQKLADLGYFEGCDRCPNAFHSVMASNLTLVRNVIAGDAWGLLSVPLMENYPETVPILLLMLVTIQFGVLNIVTAVVVDRIQDARQRDDQFARTLREEDASTSYRELMGAFNRTDIDGNGTITMNELKRAYRCNPNFRELMLSLDISTIDLGIIFDILDTDGSGDISAAEFVRELHLMKTRNSNVTLAIIRHQIEKMNDEIAGSLRTELDYISQHLRKALNIESSCHESVRASTYTASWYGHSEGAAPRERTSQAILPRGSTWLDTLYGSSGSPGTQDRVVQRVPSEEEVFASERALPTPHVSELGTNQVGEESGFEACEFMPTLEEEPCESNTQSGLAETLTHASALTVDFVEVIEVPAETHQICSQTPWESQRSEDRFDADEKKGVQYR